MAMWRISYNNLALLYNEQKKYTEAEPLHHKALKIRKKLFGTKDLDVAQSYHNLAGVAQSYHNLAGLYISMGRYSEAEPLVQKALAIKKEVLGKNHLAVAESYNTLGNFYAQIGKFDQAKCLFEKALAIFIEQHGENYPSVAISHNNLANLYYSMGRYGEAIACYQKALEIARRSQGLKHPNTVTIQNHYLRTMMKASEEEILKVVPEEMHDNYRQMKQEWERYQSQENPEE